MNAMDSIEKLDAVSRDKFQNRAHRLIQVCYRVADHYHANPIKRDFFAEAEAIAAWMIVTSCYSGIEQSMKCLLQMRESYIDEERSKGGDRHHYIGELFEKLDSRERDVIRTYYSAYRLLHDYIPLQTADCFLRAIDDGYPKWRYFLSEDNRPPKTHCGAMVEIWTALSAILRARVFTNHGLQTVIQRIYDRLHETIVVRSLSVGTSPGTSQAELDDLNSWVKRNGGLLAAFARFLRLRDSNATYSLNLMDYTLKLLLAAAESAECEKSNQDFKLYVQRARAGTLPSELLGKPLESTS